MAKTNEIITSPPAGSLVRTSDNSDVEGVLEAMALGGNLEAIKTYRRTQDDNRFKQLLENLDDDELSL